VSDGTESGTGTEGDQPHSADTTPVDTHRHASGSTDSAARPDGPAAADDIGKPDEGDGTEWTARARQWEDRAEADTDAFTPAFRAPDHRERCRPGGREA
jgi:hypothetical protein